MKHTKMPKISLKKPTTQRLVSGRLITIFPVKGAGKFSTRNWIALAVFALVFGIVGMYVVNNSFASSKAQSPYSKLLQP